MGDKEIASREEERLQRLLGGEKGKVATVVRPKLSFTSGEKALQNGETEEEMIQRKSLELRMKARQKERREQEPEWKKRQKEREEREGRERELREQQMKTLYRQNSNPQTLTHTSTSASASAQPQMTEEQYRNFDLSQERERLARERRQREEIEAAACLMKEDDDTQTATEEASSESAKKEEARLRGHWLSTEGPSSPLKAEAVPVHSSPKEGANAWNVERVSQWLGTIGIDEDKVSGVQDAFKKNDINGKNLLSLSKEELDEIGVTSLGIKKLVLAAVDTLKASQ